MVNNKIEKGEGGGERNIFIYGKEGVLCSYEFIM
jgi:hypothetical protein